MDTDSTSGAWVKPCIKCHTQDRYASGACKYCAKQNSKAQRERRPEHYKAARAASHLKNKEKANAQAAAYYSANRERLLVTFSRWRAANRENLRDYFANHYAINAERIKKRVREYRAQFPDRVKAVHQRWIDKHPKAKTTYRHNRRVRERGNGERLSRGIVKKLLVLQNGKCPCCKMPLGNSYHLDHRLPLALGGTNTDDNMQLLRARCNLQKGKKHPIEFMRSKGYLL